MIGLRIIGILIGTLLILWGFFSFRSNKIGRMSLLFTWGTGLSLCLLAINPDVANILRDTLFQKEFQYGRIIAILIVSNLLTWLMLIYVKNSLDKKDKETDELVLKLAMDEFREKNGDVKFEDIAIIIPAYNEVENLKILLEAVDKEVSELNASILIIDDASADGTFQYLLQKGCYAISNKINRGGGAALKLGYRIAGDAGGSGLKSHGR